MKKFVFKLEVMAKTKEIEQDQVKKMLAERFACLYAVNDRLDMLNTEIELMHIGQVISLREGVSPAVIERYRQCAAAFIAEFEIKRKEKEQIERQISETQDELKRIMGELKGFENLKEKQFAEYLIESKKNGELEIDEFISGKITVNDDKDFEPEHHTYFDMDVLYAI